MTSSVGGGLPDLTTTHVLGSGSVRLADGRLADGLPWRTLKAVMDSWRTTPRAFAERAAHHRRDAGFEVTLDERGFGSVSVADRASLNRLDHALADAAPSDGSAHRRLQTVRESPAAAQRAVLECFYGPVWSEGSRSEVLRAAALHGATMYVYGPVADPMTGKDWRAGPSDAQLASYQALVGEAGNLGVTPAFRISPFAPTAPEAALRLGDDRDVTSLTRRLLDLSELGFHTLVVGFDDITTALEPSVAARYAHDVSPLGAAHAELIRTLAEVLLPRGVQLVACPTHYWGSGPSPYRERFADLLPAGVDLCWTGPGVISGTISGADARAVRPAAARGMWLWDNVPVNDWDAFGEPFADGMLPRRLPVGGLQGRTPDLVREIAGYGCNAALQPIAGLPAVLSALDWAWGPERYDPERSVCHAASDIGVPAEDMLALAAVLGPLPGLWAPPAAVLGAVGRLLAGLPAGPEPETVLELLQELERHLALAGRLAAGCGDFAREVGPWVQELALGCRAALHAVDVLDAYGRDQATVDGIAPRLREMVRSGPRPAVAGGALDVVVDVARGLAGGGTPPLPE